MHSNTIGLVLTVVLAVACSDEKPPERLPPLLDCDVLIEPADLANACGVPIAEVTVEPHTSDDRHATRVCTLGYDVTGRPSVLVSFNWAGKAAIARDLVDHELGDAKLVEVGDRARLDVTRFGNDPTHVRHKLLAAKNYVVVRITADDRAGEPAPCTDAGLVALARAIIARLK